MFESSKMEKIPSRCGRFGRVAYCLLSRWRLSAPLVALVATMMLHTALQGQSLPDSLGTGPELVDWTPGSPWMQGLARNGRTIDPRTLKMAPPAKGRDRLNVRAKEKERAGKKVKAKSTDRFAMAYAASVEASLGLGEQDTPLIEEITFGLDNNYLAIYNWVLTKVEYVPYQGLRQGAHVTALELRGNDYDQCVLLVSLLKQAGLPVDNIKYVLVDVTYSAAQIQQWLQWDFAFAKENFEAFGMTVTSPTSTSLALRRVMVQIDLDGQTYRLDPAFKTTERSSPMAVSDLVSTYSASTLTAQAGGTAPTDDEISNVNVAGFQTALAGVATQYVRNAAQDHHAKSVQGILGLPVGSQAEVSSFIPAAGSVVETWTEIPSDRSAKIILTLGTAANSWSRIYHWCDIADDIFNLSFAGDGRASLYRDFTLEGTETGTVSGDFTIKIERVYHPALAEAVYSTPMTRSGRSVILPTFSTSRGRLKQMQERQAHLDFTEPNSDGTLFHSLALVGLQRAVHQENYVTVASAMADRIAYDAGSFWILHSRSSQWWVDGPKQLMSARKIRATSIPYGVFWDSVWAWGSATEHLCLEQISTTAAKSTTAVFESALREGRAIFRMRPGNRDQMLARIDGGVFSEVLSHVNSNEYAFVTSKLQVPIYGGSALNGKAAYLPRYHPPGTNYEVPGSGTGWRASGAWLIDGGFNGGGTNNGSVQAAAGAAKNKAGASQQTMGGDPVDLFTGAFLYHVPGLTLGSGGVTTSLNLSHSYSSARRLQDSALLGSGWSHSYDIFATRRHLSDMDMRTASLAEIAPMVVAIRYLFDTTTHDPSAKEIALRAMTVNWATRLFVNSQVVVAMGGERMLFQRLADDSYLHPSHAAVTLAKLGTGAHEMTFKHGNKVKFQAFDDTSTAGRAVSIVDPYTNTLSFTYVNGRLDKVIDTYGRSLSFAYDSTKLLSVSDSSSRTVTYSRGADFRITTQVKDPDPVTGAASEWSTTIFESSSNRISRVIDGRSRSVIQNHYDGFDRVWGQEPMGDAYKFTEIRYAPGETIEVDATGLRSSRTMFDHRGRRISHRNGLGHVQTWTYDGSDRLEKHVSARNATTTFTYSPSHALLSVTRPNPTGTGTNTRTIALDVQGRPEHVYNFEGKATSYTYNDLPGIYTIDVKTVTIPGGISTSYTYDAKGRIQTHHPAAFAAGQVITYTYDGYGNIDKIIYPGTSENVDDYTFNSPHDVRGDVTQIIARRGAQTTGAKTTFAYNSRRQLTSQVRWKGTLQLKSETFYDAVGDVDYTIDASGRKVDFDYDELGHLLTVKRGPSNAQITTLTKIYDSRNLLWKTRDALGNESEFLYDGAQRLQDRFDPLRRQTRMLYDADGNPTTVYTPLGLIPPAAGTTTAYTLSGFKDGTSDAHGQTVDYSYDRDGRMTGLGNRLKYDSTILPRTFTWSYDDDARIVTTKTPRQQPARAAGTKSTIATSNARGLPQSVQEPSGQTTTFDTYDNEGRLKQRTDGVGLTTYAYWPNGLLKRIVETTGTGSARVSRMSLRSYDQLNQLTYYREGEAKTTAAGDLELEPATQDPIFKQALESADNTLRYDYHADGALSEIVYPDGRKVGYAYDDFGRLWKVTDWSNRVTTYTYDDAGRLQRIDRPNGTYRVQEYDAASQLRFIKDYRSNGSLLLFNELRYDADGRITSSFLHPKPGTFGLPVDNLLYDDDNRLSAWNAQAVAHDDDGNMTSGPLPSGVFGSYGYDARNRLVSAGGASYRYNADGLRVEIVGTGAAVFVVDPNTALPRTLKRTVGGTATFYVYGLGLLYEETGGLTKTYHFNQVGNTLALTDGAQNVTDTVSYTPFGARTGTADTPFLFNGEYGAMTESNDLVYMRARYYNPRIMRFVNADPIGFAGGLNHYAFCGNNPINHLDPSGLGRITPNGKVGIARLAGVMRNIGRSLIALLSMAGQAGAGDPYTGSYDPSMSQSVGLATVMLMEKTDNAITDLTGISEENFDSQMADGMTDLAAAATGVAGLARKAATKLATEAAESRVVSLTAEQAKNVARFEKSLPGVPNPTVVRPLPNGGVAAQANVPGRVPGSFATYEKQIDATGKTIQYTKTTVDPAGNIVHVKDKINGVQLP